MRSRGIAFAVLAVAVCLATDAPAQADGAEPDRMTLSNYAIRTPSAIHMAIARRDYYRGQYASAFARYTLAARWANKHAQAWLGWMYLLGRGVERDTKRAWAWMKLAAERGYPEFVEEAENFLINLNRWERIHARLIYYQELLPKYGDKVAIPRTERQMWRRKMEVSGTRLGHIGNLRHGDPTNFYAEDQWDFHKVVAFETRAHNVIARARGRVTLGDLRVVDESAEDGGNETDSRDSQQPDSQRNR